jgi:hypothetical protein
VKERDAQPRPPAPAIGAEVFAGVVPPPMQTQIQGAWAGGMSSAVIGGFCEHSPVVHELVAKFADMTAKETAKDLEGARVAAQRGHDIPEARPHTPAAGHRQGHGATSTKTKSRACPTWTPAPSRHARFATCRRRTCARWGECGEQRKMEWALSRPEAWRCV